MTPDLPDMDSWSNEERDAWDALNEQQRVFVVAFVGEANFNQTRAADLAGYGGTYGSKRAIGSRLLTIVNINTVKDALLRSRIMPAHEVMARVSEDARASMEDFVDEHGDFSLREAKERGVLGAIKKLKVRSGLDSKGLPWTETSIELVDRQAALRDLLKAYGVTTKSTIELTGKDGKDLNLGVTFDLSGLTDEEVDLLERALEKASDAQPGADQG